MINFFVMLVVAEVIGVLSFLAYGLFTRWLPNRSGGIEPSVATGVLVAIAMVGGFLTLILSACVDASEGELTWGLIGVFFLLHAFTPTVIALAIEIIRARLQAMARRMKSD